MNVYFLSLLVGRVLHIGVVILPNDARYRGEMAWSLPYLQGGQALTPAQRWAYQLGPMRIPNVTTRLQVKAIKP